MPTVEPFAHMGTLKEKAHMSTNSKLSTVARFLVLRMTLPAGEAVVVKRKKGYISFLNEENACKMAKRLAAKTPGARFYVAVTTEGHFLPSAVTLQSTTYS
jgi:hypothetical protein